MKAGWDLACLLDIPTMVVASNLAKESLFNDKSDIYREACNIKAVGSCGLALSQDVLRAMDPLSRDGVVSTQVKRHISSLNKRLVSQEAAIKNWGLDREDLEGLASYKKQDGTKLYKNDGRAVFYRLKDVRRMSAKKYQSADALLNAIYPGATERIALLIDSLEKHNVTMRLDSAACLSFIVKGAGNPEEIARRLKEMDFYHTYTDYKELFDHYTDRYRVEYGYYDRDHISKDAKAVALASFVKKHPDKTCLIPESLRRFCVEP